MKKYVLLTMFLCGSLMMTSCGGTANTPATDTKTEGRQEQNIENDTEEKDTSSGELGECTFSINEYALTNDYEGNPAIIVDFDFTNNTAEAKSFMVVALPKLFQDGIELEHAIITDDGSYNAENSMKDIKTGVTLNVQEAWVLNNTTSPVEVELQEMISFDNQKLTKTFEIAQ